jgi:hypothetical protein
MLQSDTEYIDERPYQPASTKSPLHRAAGPYIGVKSSLSSVCSPLPVYNGKQTSY